MTDPWVFTDDHYAHCIAAHAVVAWLQGFPIRLVSIKPLENKAAWIEVIEPALPRSGPIRSDRDQRAADAIIRCLLAELAALLHYGFGKACGDMGLRFHEILEEPILWDVILIAGRLETQDGPVISKLYEQVAEFIDTTHAWEAVTAIAHGLMLNRELDGDSVYEIIGRRLRGRPRPYWSHLLGVTHDAERGEGGGGGQQIWRPDHRINRLTDNSISALLPRKE